MGNNDPLRFLRMGDLTKVCGFSTRTACKLIAAVNRAGIPFVLARTWEGDRQLERRLKRRKGAPRLCPICRAEAVKGGA